MLESVEEQTTYLSPSGIPFKVLYLGQHGQDCTLPMVVYTNLEPTKDKRAGEIWVMEESLFMKLFRDGHGGYKEVAGDDYPLIRAILLAHYEKPTTLLTGTINWAAHIAAKIKGRLKKDQPNVE